MTDFLVCPGLLGPLPRAWTGNLPHFPGLERFLARARQVPAVSGLQRTLFDLFELPVDPGSQAATAAVAYAAESDAMPLPSGSCLMHADPVHLRPDQDRLLATDLTGQPLSPEDAAHFVEAFNRHFANDGLRLIAVHPTRWYLVVVQAPDVASAPLNEIIGRNLDRFLPEGKDALRWRSLINEVQMLFHDLPVNRQRESAGLLPVSGLWFSGGGSLPDRRARGFARCEGGDILLRGLDRLADARRDGRLRVDTRAEQALCAGDAGAWRDAVGAIEALIEARRTGELCLMPCDGRAWHWRPGMRRAFWRRVRPLTDWFATYDDQA